MLESKLTGKGADSLSLKQLDQLRSECKQQLEEDDPLWQKLEALTRARTAKKRTRLATMVASEGQTVSKWSSILAKCKKELPKSDPLISEAVKRLEDRQRTHRIPLADAVDAATESSLRELDNLERRCCTELPEDDTTYIALRELIKLREQKRRQEFVVAYTKMVKRIKDVSVVELSTFVKEAEAELPSSDSLLAQIMSLQEARVLNKTDSSKSKAKSISKEGKRRKKKPRERDLEAGLPPKRLSKNFKPTFWSALREDISGFTDSNLYKVVFLSVFAAYAVLMYYTLQLVFLVSPFTWRDVVSSILGSFTGDGTQDAP